MPSFMSPEGSARRWVTRSAALLLVGLTSSVAAAAPPPLDLGGGVQLALVEVQAGTFVQGSSAQEPGHAPDEGRRDVHLTRPFWIGRSPVTVGQFRRFADDARYVTEAETGSSGGFGWDGTKLVQRKGFTWRSPGFAQTDDHPVVIVTFGDAQAFAAWASRKTGLTVRLPTEAEWEMAAHAGTKTRFFWGNDEALAEQRAWFAKNAANGTRPVGTKGQNEWGLQDPAGNVWQWCLDFHGPITSEAATDPEARSPVTWEHSDKPRRVLKGGSWLTNDRWKLRPAARSRATEGSRNADFGFRVVAQRGGAPALATPVTPAPGTPPSTGGPPGKAPSTGTSSGWTALAGGGVCLMGVLLVGVVLVLFIRGLVKGSSKPRGPAGAAMVPPNVLVRMAIDGFWLVAPDGRTRAEVTYVIRTHTRTAPGSVVVDPGPRGTFVYTGEPAIDVRITGVRVVSPPMSTASHAPAARGRSRGSENAWHHSSADDDSSWHHAQGGSSGTSAGWPSAY